MRGKCSNVLVTCLILWIYCTCHAFFHGRARNLLLNRPRIARNARIHGAPARTLRLHLGEPHALLEFLKAHQNDSGTTFIPSRLLSSETERRIRANPEILQQVNAIPYHVLYAELRRRDLPIVGDNVQMFARTLHHDIGLPYTFGEDDNIEPPEMPAELQQMAKALSQNNLHPNGTLVLPDEPVKVIRRPHDGLSRSDIVVTVGHEDQLQTQVKSYVVKSPQLTHRKSGRRLVVLLSDVRGHNRRNVRKLADTIALQMDSIVVVPDMFRDDPLVSEDRTQMKLWSQKHRPRQIEGEMYRFLQAAKDRWNTTLAGFVGVGFGADIALNIAAQYSPLNKTHIPKLLEPKLENELERDETLLLRKRAELDANLYSEYTRRQQQDQQSQDNVTYDGGEDQVPLWDGFNISEMFDEHGLLKEETSTDDKLALDQYIAYLVEEQRREEEAEANRTRSNTDDTVVEHLIDEILSTGHKESVSALSEVLLNEREVLPQLQQLKARLVNETKSLNSLPDRLAARREWYLAGPDAVVAISPSLTRSARLANNLTQPIMMVQAGLGAQHERAQKLFETLKSRPSPPLLFFSTFKDCSPSFATDPRGDDEARCADQVRCTLCTWLDANLRQYSPFELDTDATYDIIGMEDAFDQLTGTHQLTHIHDHLPP